MLATLIVFTASGPVACQLESIEDDTRIMATVNGRRWRMDYSSLAEFLRSLSAEPSWLISSPAT